MANRKRKQPNRTATRKPDGPAAVPRSRDRGPQSQDEFDAWYARQTKAFLDHADAVYAESDDDEPEPPAPPVKSRVRRLRGRELHSLPWKARRPVAVLEQTMVDLERAQQNVADAVAGARSEGISWRLIGELTGLNHETARKRWGSDRPIPFFSETRPPGAA